VAKVALNQSTSWWRHRRREVGAPQEHASAADPAPFDEALLALVWRLPPRQRQVIGLRILLDLSIRETAEVMGTRYDAGYAAARGRPRIP